MPNTLSLGFAQADITPAPNTVFLDGYGFREAPAEGMHHPIFAKVAAFSDGKNRFAIISLDICGFGTELAETLRLWVRGMAGLADHEFSLCATHTHSGPATGILCGLPINMLYWNKVGRVLANLVTDALANAAPCDLRFSFGTPLTLCDNRRPGRTEIDRRVPVLSAYDQTGKLRGVIVSASCHAVSNMDMDLTGDYPSILTEAFASRYPGVPVLFLQGRGADVNPHMEDVSAGELRYAKLGNELVASVIEGLNTPISNLSAGTLQSTTVYAEIPLTYPSREELAEGLETVKDAVRSGEKQRRNDMEFLWHMRALDAVTRGDVAPKRTVQISLFTIGGQAAFVFLPFEILTATGNAVETMLTARGIPTERAFVIGYSNGTNGYLAPSADCGMGDYETKRSAHWYAMPECAPVTEQAVLAEVEKLLLLS